VLNNAVYVYNGLLCDANPESPDGAAAFNDGIEFFTTRVNAEQKVTSLHNITLSVIKYNDLIYKEYTNGELTLDQHNIRRRLDIEFSIRSEPECTLFIWCSEQERESNEQVLIGNNHDIIEALAIGIGAVDDFYSEANEFSVLPTYANKNSGAILAISEGATERDILVEVMSLFGKELKLDDPIELDALKLVDPIELAVLLDAISIERGENLSAALVNIQPLYDKVLERFNDELFVRTKAQYDRLESAKDDINYCKTEHPSSTTTFGIQPNVLGFCNSTDLMFELSGALDSYESALDDTREKLIEDGFYPRHEFDIEEDAFRNAVLNEVLLAVVGGDVAMVARGLKGIVKGVVESAAARLGFKFESIAAENALVRSLERFVAKRETNLAGACSFHGDTLVKTSDGYLPIRDLRAGKHQVWSRDQNTQTMAYKPVLGHYADIHSETVDVTLRDVDTGMVQTIISNRIHPYFVQLPDSATSVGSSEGHSYSGTIDRGAWVDAGELQPGYRLLNDDSTWAEVVSVTIEAQELEAFNLTVADYHTYFVAGSTEASAVWVHNKCYDAVPNAYQGTGNKNQFGQDTYTNANGDKLYRGHDGRYYDPKFHPPTPFANKLLDKNGLTTEEREYFRGKIDDINNTPEITQDWRYSRNQQSRENRGLEPLSRDEWVVLNNQILKNQERGRIAEDGAREALSGHLKKDLSNNNLGNVKQSEKGTNGEVTTRPDSLGDGIVHEHKHFTKDGDQVVYNTKQMDAQRTSKEFAGKEHHVTISSDNPVNLLGDKPNPRPSGKLAKKSEVSYYDIEQGKITHTWESDLNDKKGGWEAVD
jgi:hypothetical protein